MMLLRQRRRRAQSCFCGGRQALISRHGQYVGKKARPRLRESRAHPLMRNSRSPVPIFSAISAQYELHIQRFQTGQYDHWIEPISIRSFGEINASLCRRRFLRTLWVPFCPFQTASEPQKSSSSSSLTATISASAAAAAAVSTPPPATRKSGTRLHLSSLQSETFWFLGKKCSVLDEDDMLAAEFMRWEPLIFGGQG